MKTKYYFLLLGIFTLLLVGIYLYENVDLKPVCDNPHNFEPEIEVYESEYNLFISKGYSQEEAHKIACWVATPKLNSHEAITIQDILNEGDIW